MIIRSLAAASVESDEGEYRDAQRFDGLRDGDARGEIPDAAGGWRKSFAVDAAVAFRRVERAVVPHPFAGIVSLEDQVVGVRRCGDDIAEDRAFDGEGAFADRARGGLRVSDVADDGDGVGGNPNVVEKQVKRRIFAGTG